MLRTHRAGKGPGGGAGGGGAVLGSRNRRGPGVPPNPGLRGQGTSPGSQQTSWARVGRANTLLSSPAPPVWEGPFCLPLLISPASLLCPQEPMQPGRGFGGQGIGLGAQQAPWARVSRAITLHSSPASPRGPLLPASPNLPGLRDANPVWPPLLLPLQSPYVLPVHSGVPPVSLGVRVPHQWPAGALVVGRH